MRELGYVPAGNVAFEDRSADGDFGRLPGLPAELARAKLDVIVAVATGAIRAARNATRTIPIVMEFSGVDPVKAGFVASLNRPGGNATGITMLAPELSAKRLDVLKQALPAARRVGVLGYRTNPGTESAEAGGIVSYGVSNLGLYRHAARFVDRLFKGAKPADLPVEQPTTFELVINLKTARALGLSIPPALLQRADHVIE